MQLAGIETPRATRKGSTDRGAKSQADVENVVIAIEARVKRQASGHFRYPASHIGRWRDKWSADDMNNQFFEDESVAW